MKDYTLYCGDALRLLKTIDSECMDCVVTSPPYWGLRDYGVKGQIGLEETPQEYIEKIVQVFSEVKRILKRTGTVWLNLGDSYAGSGHGYGSEIKGKQKTNKGTLFMAQKHPFEVPSGLKAKDLVGIPWRIAFALQAVGYYLRADIIWHKPNVMPESVKDRPTKSHEYIFLLTKSHKYYYDADAIRETTEQVLIRKASRYAKYRAKSHNPKCGITQEEFAHLGTAPSPIIPLTHPRGRNKRTVWSVQTKPFKEAHFATFPEKLIEPCILAGCPPGGAVMDPFCGSGTTGVVSLKNDRNFLGMDINWDYLKMTEKRLKLLNDGQLLFPTQKNCHD
jgi:DNA modification methylase